MKKTWETRKGCTWGVPNWMERVLKSNLQNCLKNNNNNNFLSSRSGKCSALLWWKLDFNNGSVEVMWYVDILITPLFSLRVKRAIHSHDESDAFPVIWYSCFNFYSTVPVNKVWRRTVLVETSILKISFTLIHFSTDSLDMSEQVWHHTWHPYERFKLMRLFKNMTQEVNILCSPPL